MTRAEATTGEPRDGAMLLTGATGFLGMELLARFLDRGDRHVFTLVRAGDDAEAVARIQGVLEDLYGDRDAHQGRWTAVAGDIEAVGLGLAAARRTELAAEISDIVHSAASVSFTLPLAQSRRINVTGTKRVLEFAELCAARDGLRRLAYVSTAYVAGDHAGTFSEDDLDLGQKFRNAYERSKFEAERLVRASAGRLPVQIFRPSIIVGEQGSGWTPSFNVIYPPLKAFEAGAYPILPARASTPVDVVPVDYVADAIVELTSRPVGRSEAHHLVAGGRATTVGRLAARAGRFFGRRPPRLVPPRLYRILIHPLLVLFSRGRRRQALRRTEALFPYFSMRVRFDNRRTRSLLEGAGLRVPVPESYLDRLLGFAVEARWGRTRPSRAEAQAAR